MSYCAVLAQSERGLVVICIQAAPTLGCALLQAGSFALKNDSDVSPGTVCLTTAYGHRLVVKGRADAEVPGSVEALLKSLTPQLHLVSTNRV